MVEVMLVDPVELPRWLNAYAIRERGGDVVFVVRQDMTPEQIAAAINRLGELGL